MSQESQAAGKLSYPQQLEKKQKKKKKEEIERVPGTKATKKFPTWS